MRPAPFSVVVASVRLDVGLENMITFVDNAKNYCLYKVVYASAGTGDCSDGSGVRGGGWTLLWPVESKTEVGERFRPRGDKADSAP